MADDGDDLDDLLDEFGDDVLQAGMPGLPTVSATATPANPVDEISIQDLIADLDIKDPATMAQLQELAGQFSSKSVGESNMGKGKGIDKDKDTDTPPKKKTAAFDSVIKETAQRLHKRDQSLDDDLDSEMAASNPQNLLALLLAGKDGDEGDMLNLLVEMLEQLLSKEVLYEPIKDLNTKYPGWLNANASALSDEDSLKYNQQYALTTEILAIFDDSKYSDDNSAQRDTINALLESLQDLGQPPADLVSDGGDIPGLGAFGDDGDLDFSDKDLPPGFQKELEEGCKQT